MEQINMVKELKNVFKAERKNQKVVISFINKNKDIDMLIDSNVKDFFKWLSKRYIEGCEIKFNDDLDKLKAHEGKEKLKLSVAQEFALSFKAEWEQSKKYLDNIKKAQDQMNRWNKQVENK